MTEEENVKLLYDWGDGREVWFMNGFIFQRHGHVERHGRIDWWRMGLGHPCAWKDRAGESSGFSELEDKRTKYVNDRGNFPFMITLSNVAQGTHWVYGRKPDAEGFFDSIAKSYSSDQDNSIELGIFVPIKNDRNIKDY